MRPELRELRLRDARREMDTAARQQDAAWHRWMRASAGTPESYQRMNELAAADAALARARRVVAELEGRPWLSVAM